MVYCNPLYNWVGCHPLYTLNNQGIFRGSLNNFTVHTLPETNSSHLKMDGWYTVFLVSFWGVSAYFFTNMFFQGSVFQPPFLHNLQTNNFMFHCWKAPWLFYFFSSLASQKTSRNSTLSPQTNKWIWPASNRSRPKYIPGRWTAGTNGSSLI